MGDDSDINTIIEFFDSVCKGIEGLKDKFSQLILEIETKNDKIDQVLKQWVNAIKQLIEEKHYQYFNEQYDDDLFYSKINFWLIQYKDNNDLLLNIKLLQKNLTSLKSTIKTKIISSDPLCYTNLTESLINKNKSK
jgi:hypothetical protein